MNNGMLAAISGNLVAQQRLDVLSNNLANVNTSGFKRDRLIFGNVLGSVKIPSQETGTTSAEPMMAVASFATDYADGPLKQTGNTFDLALEGSGFFVINTPDGRAYTRQGNFHIDANNKLVNLDGFELMGSGGPITITGGSVVIDSKGGVIVDGNQVASLAVVDFPKPYELEKIGNVQFKSAGSEADEQPVKGTMVKQGYLEDSNVNPLIEMAQLIETNRYYESCVKAIQNYDNIAGKTVNEFGKL